MVNSGVASNQTFTGATSEGVGWLKPGAIEDVKTITAKRNGRMRYDRCFNSIHYPYPCAQKHMAETDNIQRNVATFTTRQFNPA